MLRRHANLLPLLLLTAATVVTLLLIDRPLVRGDGVAYLAWIDTLVLDRDVDFGNQLEKLGPVNTYQIAWDDAQQKLVNIFPFGIALVQAPFYAAGHAFAQRGWWDVNTAYFAQMQGVSSAYSVWLMIGANTATLATVLLGWWMARQFIGRYSAALLAWGIYMGSPLLYYATISPVNSHNPGALAMTAFIALLLYNDGTLRRGGPQPVAGWQWALLGAAGGVTVLIRWQLLLVVAFGFALLLWRRQWRGALIAGATALIAVLPLPLVWQTMYGAPFVVPFEAAGGGSFFSRPVNAWLVLRELFRHSPILLFGAVGIVFLWRRSKAWAVLVAGSIIAQALVNGATLDWWGGETYGMRRMSELYPLYLMAAAALFAYVPQRAQRQQTWRTLTRGAFALVLVYTAFYFLAFVDFTWTNQMGVFIESPELMLRHFWAKPNRWEVLAAVIRSHIGPWAWSMPGP